MDKGLEYEQNLAGRNIAILILRAMSNRLADLLPLVPDLLRTMKLARKGEIHRIIGGESASQASELGAFASNGDAAASRISSMRTA